MVAASAGRLDFLVASTVPRFFETEKDENSRQAKFRLLTFTPAFITSCCFGFFEHRKSKILQNHNHSYLKMIKVHIKIDLHNFNHLLKFEACTVYFNSDF